MIIRQGKLLLHLHHGFHQLLPGCFRFAEAQLMHPQFVLRVSDPFIFPGHCDFLLMQRFQRVRRASLQLILVSLTLLHIPQQLFQLILSGGKRFRQFLQFPFPGKQIHRFGRDGTTGHGTA